MNAQIYATSLALLFFIPVGASAVPLVSYNLPTNAGGGQINNEADCAPATVSSALVTSASDFCRTLRDTFGSNADIGTNSNDPAIDDADRGFGVGSGTGNSWTSAGFDIDESYAPTVEERIHAAEANQDFFEFSIDLAPEVDTISITQLTIGINPQGNGPDGLAVLARKDDPDGNSVFEIVAENIIPNSSSVVTAPFTLNLDEVTGIEDLIEFRLVGYDSRFDDSRGWLGLRDNGTPGVFLTIEGGVVPLPATAFMLLTGVAALLGWQTCSARAHKGTQATTPKRQLAAG